MPIIPGYLTPTEAATEAGYADASAIRHAIRNGFLKTALKLGQQNLIAVAEFERWVADGKRIWPSNPHK